MPCYIQHFAGIHQPVGVHIECSLYRTGMFEVQSAKRHYAFGRTDDPVILSLYKQIVKLNKILDAEHPVAAGRQGKLAGGLQDNQVFIGPDVIAAYHDVYRQITYLYVPVHFLQEHRRAVPVAKSIGEPQNSPGLFELAELSGKTPQERTYIEQGFCRSEMCGKDEQRSKERERQSVEERGQVDRFFPVSPVKIRTYERGKFQFGDNCMCRTYGRSSNY